MEMDFVVELSFRNILAHSCNHFLSLSSTPSYPYPLSLFTRASWRYSSLGCSLAAPRLLSILILILIFEAVLLSS